MHCKAPYDTLNHMRISSWQDELRESLQDSRLLLEKLGLQANKVGADAISDTFPLKAPESYLNRIKKYDPTDPLLRQILPLEAENTKYENYVTDPVGDLNSETVPGLLHKYHGRVLLVTTGACAIHCRYCFRRHFPYAESNPANQNWQPALNYIRNDSSISEVILSGGDPLMLADNKLLGLFDNLAGIAHLKRLRIHSRIPAVLPSRITDSFLALFQDLRLTPVMVLHVNHVNEIDESVESSLQKLVSAGISLLNQTVLLQGVNDSSEAISALNEKLFESGVLPYYLHMLDKVEGAAHFAVEEEHARTIMTRLRETLPGYLVPRLIREQAGSPYKLPVL
jgi:EF-P beta-lysylation protein EpmB